jgi:pyruvate,orthophosphate dikinase
MADRFPTAYSELEKHAETLEQYNRDMQDIEFTIESDKLFILQTRNGKRTARAAVKLAVDLVEEGLISKEDALLRVDPTDLLQLLLPQLPADHGMDIAATGLAASPGAAIGLIVLDADVAEARAAKGDKVILVRPETSPDDIHGFIAAEGILTAKGGLTSHAAVVARGMGKPCIAGCSELEVDLDKRVITLGGTVLEEGSLITIDGTSGSVIIGEPELVPASAIVELDQLLEWADSTRRLKVYANADTPVDAENARKFGAEGIGLCRTEHMFFGEDRLPKMQAMILANTDEARAAALAELQPIQTQDFFEIFSTLGQYPVIIRLLDPPLHEFLPHRDEVDSPEMIKRIDDLSETNPMLGMRGCRLGLVYPEIYDMQIQAIADAVVRVHEEKGVWPKAQIMLPMVGFPSEMARLREMAEKVLRDRSVTNVPIGMMIELPRSCVVADQYTELSDFFSFGTNDLTQTTLGFSRDDAENMFLGRYLEEGLLEDNPFETLDIPGVGRLIEVAVESVNGKGLNMSFGACGEHGGDPASIHFFHGVGLDYVSCSPFRIPTARLAAAQAALKAKV